MDHLNQTIRVKFGLAISQLVDVVSIGMLPRYMGKVMPYSLIVLYMAYKVENAIDVTFVFNFHTI